MPSHWIGTLDNVLKPLLAMTEIAMNEIEANLSAGRVRLVEFFAEPGVRVKRLTCNNQNELAGICYETNYPGLARFGREVVREMNRVRMLVDLSHIGDRSTMGVVKHSQKPVAVSHANAVSLFLHMRNRRDEVLMVLQDDGGVIGCATYRNIAGDHYCRSVRIWCEMVARTVDIAGINRISTGADRSHNHVKRDCDGLRILG